MKFSTPMAITFATTILISSATTHAAVECTATSVKIVASNCKQKDRGYKPNTHCTATISAPKNHFLLSSEVSRSTAGSTHQDPSVYGTKPYRHKSIEKDSFFKGAVLQSASITAKCSRVGGGFGRRTCHAQAEIKAKAYPHSCLKEKLQAFILKL